jgi:hypothetical protein
VTVKKGGLTVNKKTPTGKDRVATRKQGKKDKKGPNPAIRSEGDKPTRMKTHSQSQRLEGIVWICWQKQLHQFFKEIFQLKNSTSNANPKL